MNDPVGESPGNERNNARAKAVAVLVGIAQFIIVQLLLGTAVGYDSKFYLPLLILSYAISGFILGAIWPDMSWRMGLWLYLIWPPMLLFMFFLSAEQPAEWRKELLDLFGYSLILIAACLGAKLGGFKRQR